MAHRVIQWGTGNVGFHSLRHIVRHPHLELVGVHAHGEKKIGRDAAALCGLSEDTGIIATNEVIRESLVNDHGIPKSLIRVIHRGVDTELLTPASAPAIQTSERRRASHIRPDHGRSNPDRCFAVPDDRYLLSE